MITHQISSNTKNIKVIVLQRITQNLLKTRSSKSHFNLLMPGGNEKVTHVY